MPARSLRGHDAFCTIATTSPSYNVRRGVWVPAFAGTTRRKPSFTCPKWTETRPALELLRARRFSVGLNVAAEAILAAEPGLAAIE
ncbi:hypothetical protein SAMN05216337_105718 [Bradyrhizobium brasilense]|uniref:Uncharacterized protein n=1 Tax=Bradyrhizobium brasilense TaxID=1419277 RepID=A0A1G7LBL4_9BRAD|nr:hypothetical protein SAMN05216337_105718 [Bradyrhizobium brasilense]